VEVPGHVEGSVEYHTYGGSVRTWSRLVTSIKRCGGLGAVSPHSLADLDGASILCEKS